MLCHTARKFDSGLNLVVWQFSENLPNETLTYTCIWYAVCSARLALLQPTFDFHMHMASTLRCSNSMEHTLQRDRGGEQT